MTLPDDPELPDPALLPHVESEWEAVIAAMDADEADEAEYYEMHTKVCDAVLRER